MWSELLLAVPGYRGHETRAAIARLNEEAGGVLPEAFFHYREGHAIPDSQAPIRILGDGYKVRVFGLGAEGARMLYAQAATVARLLIRANPGARPVWQLSEGEFEVRRLPYRVDVDVRAMVTPLPKAVRLALVEGKYGDATLGEAVGAVLRRHLERQMAWLTPDVEVPDIEQLRITRSVPVAVKAHRFWPALDVHFEANARFIGPWQLGRLQSRGYGRLSQLRKGEEA